MKLVLESLKDVFQAQPPEKRKKAAYELFQNIDVWNKLIEELRPLIGDAIEKGGIRDSTEFTQFLKKTFDESGIWELVEQEIEEQIDNYLEIEDIKSGGIKPDLHKKALEIYDQAQGYIWSDDLEIDDVMQWIKDYAENNNLTANDIEIGDFEVYWDQ